MIKWDDSYSIHNAHIDKQHQKLFNLAEKAYSLAHKHTSPEELRVVLMEFFDYVKEHFRDEEIYMQAIEYPDLEHHKKIHRELTQSLIYLIKELKTINDVKEGLSVIAQKWLLEHIVKEDIKIEQYRRSLIMGNNSDTNDNSNKLYEEVSKTSGQEYHYVCACPNLVHDVPYDIHIKIQQGHKFRCKKCKLEIIYAGNQKNHY
ncbi:MAG: hemerythrin family protein [Helicobacter sp.]|nr:hemerythrin family protein [Helicobacter sp.]